MQQTPGFSRGFFREVAVATAERHVDLAHPRSRAKMDVSDDFIGIEDLLAQAYEEDVYAMSASQRNGPRE
jgi:hypothetical protein